MNAAYLIFILIPVQTYAGKIGELDTLCEEPKFTIKSTPKNGSGNLQELRLLNEKEKSNPDLARRVLASPGGYGHSELGIRYLARFFGYQDDFSENSKEKIELWLNEQKYNRNPIYIGMNELWNKWVVNSEHRLEVPSGPFKNLPANGDPQIFFENQESLATFSNCIRNELATKMCNNYMSNGRVLEEGDRAYFGKLNGRGFCYVPVPPWKKAREENEFTQRYGKSPAKKQAK